MAHRNVLALDQDRALDGIVSRRPHVLGGALLKTTALLCF
jgi:hypothetical protein